MNTQIRVNLLRVLVFALAITASAACNAWHGGWHGGGWHGNGYAWHGGGWYHGGWYHGGWYGGGGPRVIIGVPIGGYGYYAPSCYRECNRFGNCWRHCNY